MDKIPCVVEMWYAGILGHEGESYRSRLYWRLIPWVPSLWTTIGRRATRNLTEFTWKGLWHTVCQTTDSDNANTILAQSFRGIQEHFRLLWLPWDGVVPTQDTLTLRLLVVAERTYRSRERGLGIIKSQHEIVISKYAKSLSGITVTAQKCSCR